MEEERIKKKITITLVGIIVFVLILIGTTYAVFSAVSKTEEQTITSGNLSINFTTGQILRTTDIVPIKDSDINTKATELNFSVTNEEDITGYFDITLSDIVIPTALKDLNFKWRLLEGNNVINEGNFLELNEIGLLKRSIEINSNETKTYKIQVWLSENNEEQNYMQGRSLEAKVEIKGKDRLTKSTKNKVTVLNDTTTGLIPDLRIYGKTENGKSVGENGTITIEVSQNLIKNGLGELGDNTNFSQLVYNLDGYNSLGGFNINGGTNIRLNNNSYIPINPMKEYIESACIKNNGTEATYYGGLNEYDIDNNLIYAKDIQYRNNTLTYLTKDLKDGDTIVYLNNIFDFRNDSNTPSAQLGFIFWNYEDSRGYIYPELTYSKNIWDNLYTYDSINKTNNTITLKEPWNHGTIEKGTKLSQSAAAGAYNYGLIANKTLTTEWQCFENTLYGVNNDGTGNISKFRSGTKYIKWFYFNNYSSTPNTTTDYSRIVFRENQNKETITIDISGHELLRSNGDTRDYIDYKNSRIVRKIDNSGNILTKETYENITLPNIPTYEGNTILESSDSLSPIFEGVY